MEDRNNSAVVFLAYFFASVFTVLVGVSRAIGTQFRDHTTRMWKRRGSQEYFEVVRETTQRTSNDWVSVCRYCVFTRRVEYIGDYQPRHHVISMEPTLTHELKVD